MDRSNEKNIFTEDAKIRRALISVTDKSNIDHLASELIKCKIEIISTGGTSKLLKEKSIIVKDVSEETFFPEILNGRVKTLHPKIHGGILSRRNNQNHLDELKQHNITEIDLIIINLYKFIETTQKTNSEYDIIENIDIGGPAMIRAGAKNHEFVTVITDPDDYAELIRQIKENQSTSYAFRKYLAAKAYKLTSDYDNAITKWLSKKDDDIQHLPEKISINLNKSLSMRYGENPHQKAAFYSTDDNRIGAASAKKLQGKELSYNNINYTDSAFELICEFDNPAVAIIKHANPCGVAENTDINIAWEKALQTDPISAFGGIVAINRNVTLDLAIRMKELFLEVIIAPSFSPEALQILSSKTNLRVLSTGSIPNPSDDGLFIKSIAGGMLVQSRDNHVLKEEQLNFVTKRKPNTNEINDLLFAWKVAKHTKSNAINYAKNLQTTGIGAGQMSRIDSTNIATKKAIDSANLAHLKEPLTIGSVVASDAFFPFPDGLISAADAGVTAVIQPGGSIKDKEVIAAADDRNLAMVFTSIRHFKH